MIFSTSDGKKRKSRQKIWDNKRAHATRPFIFPHRVHWHMHFFEYAWDRKHREDDMPIRDLLNPMLLEESLKEAADSPLDIVFDFKLDFLNTRVDIRSSRIFEYLLAIDGYVKYLGEGNVDVTRAFGYVVAAGMKFLREHPTHYLFEEFTQTVANILSHLFNFLEGLSSDMTKGFEKFESIVRAIAKFLISGSWNRRHRFLTAGRPEGALLIWHKQRRLLKEQIIRTIEK